MRDFGQILSELDKGQTNAEASAQLADAIAAVRSTAKAATVTLTLKVAPASKGDVSRIAIEAAIKTKLPETAVRDTLFFLDAEGNPVRKDPVQQDLELREVTQPPIKDVQL